MPFIEEDTFDEEEERKKGRIHRQWIKFTPVTALLLTVMIILVVILYYMVDISPSDPPPFYIVELDEFLPALEMADNPVIVDMRTQYQYDSAHLVDAEWGADNLCLEYGVDICSDEVCAERQPYFFYSNKGEEYHEIKRAITRTADRRCWTEVWLLDGGFEDWVANELAVEAN